MKPMVIDISHHQDKVDFDDVKSSGIVGVILKCTEGSSYVDDTYADRLGYAKDANLCVGAYHYMHPGNIADQMEWFKNNCLLEDGSRLCLDYEEDGLELDDLHDAVGWLEDHCPKMQLAIYSGHLLKEQLGLDADMVLSPHSLWLAQYTTGEPSWPMGTWPYWTLWQYTDSGSCPGVEGPVDMNYFNGTEENCRRWFGPSETKPVRPKLHTVKVAITVPDDVHVSVTINGQPA